MVAFVLRLFRFLRVLGGGHQAIRFGEFGSPAATGDLQAHTQKAPPDDARPMVLDFAYACLEGLANGTRSCATRHSRSLAS